MLAVLFPIAGLRILPTRSHSVFIIFIFFAVCLSGVLAVYLSTMLQFQRLYRMASEGVQEMISKKEFGRIFALNYQRV
jgi:hypothetical protein